MRASGEEASGQRSLLSIRLYFHAGAGLLLLSDGFSEYITVFLLHTLSVPNHNSFDSKLDNSFSIFFANIVKFKSFLKYLY